jgi:divalent metal cation (Fe/Co/Zn/Cd) transporter
VFARLMDAVDPHLVEHAEGALASTDGVRGVSGLRLRWMGHQLHADATVDVDPALSLDQAHTVAHRAEVNLTTALPKISSVVIHAHPEQRSATGHRS